MNEKSDNLENHNDAIVLNGTGAVRSHGKSVHAWIARMDYINEGGIVFDGGSRSQIIVGPDTPCYVEGFKSGRVTSGAKASDGHYVLRAELDNIPKWLNQSEHGYALPEYEPRYLKCVTCGVIHHRHSSPCECIWLAPVLVLIEIRITGLHIYRRRSDDYSRTSRERLLRWMFEPVMPAMPAFCPGTNNEQREPISKNGQNSEFSESS